MWCETFLRDSVILSHSWVDAFITMLVAEQATPTSRYPVPKHIYLPITDYDNSSENDKVEG